MTMMTHRLLVAFSALGLAACDPSAKATGAAGSIDDRRSSEHESCAATTDCAEALRCRAGTCRQADSSVKGDYYSALGRRALDAGDPGAAASAFRKAEAEYRSEDREVPPAILCGLGQALAEGSADPVQAEEAASKLHRCVRAAPPATVLYETALSSLAVLHEVGFDPVHLAREDVADRYMTRAPEKPPTDRLKVSVTADRENRSRTFREFVELLESNDVREKLIPCWKAYFEETREGELAVPLPIRHRNRFDEYRDEEVATIELDSAKATASGALGNAQKCVADVAVPLGNDLARRVGSWSRWSAVFTVTIGG